MRQNDLPRHTLIALLTLAGATLLPSATIAADFAATGNQGTLTVKVEAVGGARHKAGPGAGLDAREWKIKNSGQFTIRLRATNPVGDDSPENRAKAGVVAVTFPPAGLVLGGGALLTTALLGAGMGAWLSSMIGVGAPNTQLTRFETAIK